jgi:Leucine-rich repeat (LRR) protein
VSDFLRRNLLDSFPEQLFQRTSLEIFKASHNRLTEIPIKALNPVQSTLKVLDLSGNRIGTISDSQLNQVSQVSSDKPFGLITFH